MAFFLTVLGMVLVVEGLPYFAFPKKVKEIAQQLPQVGDSQLRAIGLALILGGLAVTYIGKNW